MKNSVLLLGVLVLVSCGSKDNVSTQGDLPLLGGGSQGQTEQPGTTAPADSRTLVQIACQSSVDVGIALPTSLMGGGQRVVDRIPRLDDSGSASPAANLSPTVLGVSGNILSALVISGAKIYSVRYDLTTHNLADKPVSLGAAGGGSSSVYSSLGFRQPRLAAASPDGRTFIFANKGTLSLRSVANPDQVVSLNISGSYVQPRWDGNEIFVDRNGGRMSQAVILVGQNDSYKVRSAPKALDGSLDQIGLRRFDADSYIWLERSDKRAVLRVWNAENNNVKNYELPNAKNYGPGFALLRSAPGQVAKAALNTKEGVFYFTLGANGAVAVDSYPYSEESLAIINNPDRTIPWSPGQIYSAANDTQLFVIVPFSFGNGLAAVDGPYGFRAFGYDSCVNPDFYRTRN